MIDEEKLAKVKSIVAGESSDDTLVEMKPKDLRKLRDAINKMLGEETSLSDMDMPKELIEQYRMVKQLQADVIDDDETPANQKAQVASTVASTLQQLTKMQTDFYTSERFRAIENLMIQYMKKLPLKTAQDFLTDYEKVGDNG